MFQLPKGAQDFHSASYWPARSEAAQCWEHNENVRPTTDIAKGFFQNHI